MPVGFRLDCWIFNVCISNAFFISLEITMDRRSQLRQSGSVSQSTTLIPANVKNEKKNIQTIPKNLSAVPFIDAVGD
jgi:hypothetical protein